LTWIDIAVVLVIAGVAALGVRQGLVGGVVDILALAFALAAGLLLLNPTAQVLTSMGLGVRTAGPVALIVLLLTLHTLAVWLLRFPAKPMVEAVGREQWHRAADAVPGMAKGVLLSAALLAIAVSLPSAGMPKSAIERSFVGPPMLSVVHRLASLAGPALGGLPGAGGMQVLPEGQQRVDLHFRAENMQVRPDAEQQLFDLVNAERSKRGLTPYAFDEALRGVARGHSEDMLRRGYFGHYDPEGLTHVERMSAVKLVRRSSAENVALAPSVLVLHQGLMNSTGHRDNILAPRFTKCGIGIYYSPVLGYMATQLFSD